MFTAKTSLLRKKQREQRHDLERDAARATSSLRQLRQADPHEGRRALVQDLTAAVELALPLSKRREPLMPKGVPGSQTHGTVTGYVYHRCRCEACHSAYTTWRRNKYGHRPAAEYNAERAAKHGTESRSKHCRCDACREASARARQARRERRKIPCERCGQPRTNPLDSRSSARVTGLCNSCWREENAVKHGSLTMYTVHRCRCEPCRAAERAYRKDLAARRAA